MLSVVSADYDDVCPLVPLAKRDGVTLTNSGRRTYWLSARSDRDVVGCLGVLLIGRRGRLRGWFVHPDHRRQGIGSLLWRAAMDDAPALGLTNLDTLTRQHHLMDELGWTRTGKTYANPDYGHYIWTP